MAFKEHIKNVWIAGLALLFVAIAVCIISICAVYCYDTIKGKMTGLMITACVLAIAVNWILIRKRPVRQRTMEALVILADYLLIVIFSLLYSLGFAWMMVLLCMLIVLILINYEVADSVPSALLLSANTLCAVPATSVLCGLQYACHISDDYGTLYLTAVSGVAYAAFGFLCSFFSLLIGYGFRGKEK